MGKLDLLLVNPGTINQMMSGLVSKFSAIEPPLWCAIIASIVRNQGYSVKIIDAEVENLSPKETAQMIIEENPLLVNLVVLGPNPSAASTPKMMVVREIMNALINLGNKSKIVLSGLHPSAIPERTLIEEKADFVCQGESFTTIPQLLYVLKKGGNDFSKVNGLWFLQAGKIISTPAAQLVENLDELPMAAWDLLPMSKYRAHNWHCFDHIDQRQPYAVIYTSLGCPFNCSYCNIHALYDGKPGIRYRSPEKVVEEIDFLVNNYKIKNIKFFDELFALREDRVSKICDLLIERNYDLNIWAYARVDTVREALMKKMRMAGIRWLAYGFESANAKVRKNVSKRFEQDKVDKAIEMTQNAGIYIIGNFIFGLPEDDLETMQETLDMAKKFNFEYVNFYTAMAYPGSKLYDETLQTGERLPEKWSGYSQYSEDALPLATKHLSSEEVLKFRDKAFIEYFTNPAYLKMVEKKFGPKVLEHVREMLKSKLPRMYK